MKHDIIIGAAVAVPWVAAVLLVSCGGSLKNADQVHQELDRYTCYASASENAERSLRDLCPVYGTEAEKAAQLAACEAAPIVISGLDLALEKCDEP